MLVKNFTSAGSAPRLADRLAGIEASPTLAMTARAKALAARGVDVVSFSAGEPDMDTPDEAKAAAAKALADGFTKYVASAGIAELREAIADRSRALGLTYDPADVVVTAGAKHALYLACQVLLDPGDEVVVPSPYWVTYPAQIALAGARAVFVACREADGWSLRAEALEAAMTPRTKMLILNSPNNPTGAVLDDAAVRAIVEVCRRRGVWILSDEIYEPMVYAPARHASPAAAWPDRTIHVHGASKAYAMTGWRVGWACGPRDVIRAMDDVASHSTSNVTSFAQKGAAEALRACDGFVETMRAAFRRRRDLVVRLLNEIPGVRCGEPRGAFYAFPNVEAAVRAKGVASAAEMAERLLDEAHVAVVPGEAFGAPGHLRLSYACSEHEIEEGCRRIRAWVEAAR